MERDVIGFAYDAFGKRVSAGTKSFTYDVDGRLIFDGSLYYLYDHTGLLGFHDTEEAAYYFYEKDAQGNIRAILDSTGNLVVKYVYDA